MTETYTGPTNSEDIEDAADGSTAALDRRADEILADAENRTFGARPLRQAIREDAVHARDWGQTRADRLRGVVEAEPLKATLYALGIGVVIGLLAAR
ncbi:hypothetical protein [Brevundimonas sp. Root1423]|uniref:hypothetical protein n=1 Tax=Brevundimonas sp. Root1423 TaxID=1736462 RepID=UPI0006FEC1AA|nr:hypothetical protein [Brevundimonas sp. Root1423]KQY91765.1 hypothetical protein ASD25_18835 [Brevundimonas sp. Root1423]